MTEDVICVDGEIKTVSKEIEEYLESMISSITSYNRNLRYVQMVGIQDELIRAELENLSTLLSSYKEKMTQILEKYQKDRKGFLSDLEKNDTFNFPSSAIGDIDILLSMFN